MDIQITDFENTCLIVLMGLITNVINHFDVDFVLPVTLADQNMERAHYRDAILNQKFWFNTACFQEGLADLESFENKLQESDYLRSAPQKGSRKPQYEELHIHEVLCGKAGTNFVGIYPAIRKFMELQGYQTHHKEQIEQILEFLEARSKGEVPTGAKFIREYILQHPLYKKDSVVSACLQTNLVRQIMNLYKDPVPAPCDCEKLTGSNSCDSQCCDELLNVFDKNFDFNELSEGGDLPELMPKKSDSLEPVNEDQ